MASNNVKMKRSRKNTGRRISPRIVILVAIGALMLVGAGYLLLPKDRTDPNYNPEVTGGASLKVDKEQIDFGDVPFNQYVVAEFVLTNVGDKTLQFTQEPYIELKEGC